MELAIASSVVAACLVGLINWLFSQPGKHQNKSHEMELRVQATEIELKNVLARVTDTEDSVEYIRENMVCKEDFNKGLERIEEIVLNHGE